MPSGAGAHALHTYSVLPPPYVSFLHPHSATGLPPSSHTRPPKLGSTLICAKLTRPKIYVYVCTSIYTSAQVRININLCKIDPAQDICICVYVYLYIYIYTYIYIHTFFLALALGNAGEVPGEQRSYRSVAGRGAQVSAIPDPDIKLPSRDVSGKRHISHASDVRRPASQFPSKSRYTINFNTPKLPRGQGLYTSPSTNSSQLVTACYKKRWCCMLYTTQGQ